MRPCTLSSIPSWPHHMAPWCRRCLRDDPQQGTARDGPSRRTGRFNRPGIGTRAGPAPARATGTVHPVDTAAGVSWPSEAYRRPDAGREWCMRTRDEADPVPAPERLREVPPLADECTTDLDQRYASAVIPAAGSRREGALPGQRAPHAWVSAGGRRHSLLDLFDAGLTLIVGPTRTPGAPLRRPRRCRCRCLPRPRRANVHPTVVRAAEGCS
jgi:hypothetical protein